MILGASGAEIVVMRAGLCRGLPVTTGIFCHCPSSDRTARRPRRQRAAGALEGFSGGQITTTRAICARRSKVAATLRPLLLLTESNTGSSRSTSNQSGPLVLSVDQAEALFLPEGDAEAKTFISLLRELALASAPNMIALFTIRSDAYEQLQLARELEGVRQEMLNLPPMPKGSYAEVIKGPALRLESAGRPLKLEGSLVETLLADIEEGGGKDALALLAGTGAARYS